MIDQNDTTQAIKTWTGTLAQYNAIATKDPDTLYNITDDTDFTLTLLETLYPVGSIYETTNATCPLASLISGSTWLQETSRVLVDKYVSGTKWWELYSDGWCRQGGVQTLGTDGYGTVNFLKAFRNTDYSFLCDIGRRSDDSAWHIYPTSNYTASTMQLRANLTGYTLYTRWQAEGYTSTTTTHKRFRRTA